jgi:hypothetical protein
MYVTIIVSNIVVGLVTSFPFIVIGGFNAGYSYYTTIDENNICNPDVYDKNDSHAVLLYIHMLNVASSLYFIAPLIVLFTVTPVIIVIPIREFVLYP